MPEIAAPGSKSQTQRALVLAALSPGPSTLIGALDCDDSRHLRAALRALGAKIDDAGPRWRVTGGPLRTPAAPLWCGDAGTTLRFLAPLALLLDGPLRLDASAQLRRRPIDELDAALTALGVEVRAGPLTLRRIAPPAAQVEVRADRSSQFLSGLLMVAPRLPAGLTLTVAGHLVSRPYVDLTRDAMAAFGVDVQVHGDRYRVPPAPYQPTDFPVEGDWSGGAFLLVAARLTGHHVQVTGLAPESRQGDRRIAAFLDELDRPRPHRFDLTDCPDLIAPLTVACAFADHSAEITGAAHARLKESDRVAVLATELRRVGLRVRALDDGLRITPGAPARPARLDPHGDHRMAMAFGVLSLRIPGVEIDDPACVAKSYPGFWEALSVFRERGSPA